MSTASATSAERACKESPSLLFSSQSGTTSLGIECPGGKIDGRTDADDAILSQFFQRPRPRITGHTESAPPVRPLSEQATIRSGIILTLPRSPFPADFRACLRCAQVGRFRVVEDTVSTCAASNEALCRRVLMKDPQKPGKFIFFASAGQYLLALRPL